MDTLHTIIDRSTPPVPWAEGDNIPWSDPAFSERMLAEHLSQDHDLASRIVPTIDQQVAWIDDSVLQHRPSRVLDLACGPGLYLSRLAERGHSGVGIDFAPASIRHASRHASANHLDVGYVEGDIKETDFGSGFDLVMLLYGQINVFQRHQASDIVGRAVDALRPGGALIIEPQTYRHIEAAGLAGSSWTSHQAGLFSPEPHLFLTEAHWDRETHSTTQRFYVVDADGGHVSAHAMTTEAYTVEEFEALLIGNGLVGVHTVEEFTDHRQHDALTTYSGRSPGIV